MPLPPLPKRAAPAPKGLSKPDQVAPGSLLDLDQPPSARPAVVPNPPHPFDPRPDLIGDHARWVALLAAAWAVDGANPQGVYGALHGIRCCGAQLVSEGPHGANAPGRRPQWRLLPGAELTPTEWSALRATWLVPHQDTLTRLLQGGGGAMMQNDKGADQAI